MKPKINKERVRKTARVYFNRNQGLYSKIDCIRLAIIDERRIRANEEAEKRAASRREFRKANEGSIMHDMSLLEDSIIAYYRNNTYNGD